MLLLLCYASWPLYMIAITQGDDDMIICWLAITQGKELLCYINIMRGFERYVLAVCLDKSLLFCWLCVHICVNSGLGEEKGSN